MGDEGIGKVADFAPRLARRAGQQATALGFEFQAAGAIQHAAPLRPEGHLERLVAQIGGAFDAHFLALAVPPNIGDAGNRYNILQQIGPEFIGACRTHPLPDLADGIFGGRRLVRPTDGAIAEQEQEQCAAHSEKHTPASLRTQQGEEKTVSQ